MVPSPCPVCGSDSPSVFLSRPGVPVHQHLIFDDAAAARAAARGDLTLACCGACGFVFNAAFDVSKLQYGAGYDNSQDHSIAFQQHVAALVARLTTQGVLENARIVEVGCGQGAFLRALVAAHPGNVGYGFDPSYRGPAEEPDARVSFRREYYGPHCADTAADVVVCRHVIEHVPVPLDLLGAVHAALRNSSHARVFFETPCVEWILRNRVIWDFFYEHCSYFSGTSVRAAFRRAGFDIVNLWHVFSDQYLWIEAAIVAEPPEIPPPGSAVAAMAVEYGDDEVLMLERWQRRIAALRADGPVALWGAGAKGVTFANIVDPDCSRLDCVVDLNPGKQGRFVPGTGHPIVEYRDLERRHVRTVVLMNPSYRSENEALLRELTADIDLIDE
jgi:SAM-dependent methyltransferase